MVKLHRDTKEGKADRERLRIGYVASIHWVDQWSDDTWEIVNLAMKKADVEPDWWVKTTADLRRYLAGAPQKYRKLNQVLRRVGYKLDDPT